MAEESSGTSPPPKIRKTEELEKYFRVSNNGNNIIMKSIAEEPNFDLVRFIRLKDELVDLEFRFIEVVGSNYFCNISSGILLINA